MRPPLTLVLRALRCAALIIGMRITVSAQIFPSTTSITANTPSLVLPATLTLTSIINQPTLPGGVATGNVSFTADGNLLGTAPLTRLTATQSFPNAPTISFTSEPNPGLSRKGIVALDLFHSGKPALVVGGVTATSASVTAYPNMGAGQFGGAGTLTGQLSTGLTIDAMASGNFLSTTGISALVHQQGSFNQGYYNVVGVNEPESALVFFQSLSGIFSQADTEKIAIADFDGDGYSDIGVIILGEDGTVPQVGIALNQGTSGVLGEFEAFLQATLPTPPPNSGSVVFCADVITTGKFNSASNAQLAVLGHFYGDCATTPPALTPSYVALYTYAAPAPGLIAANKTSLTHSRGAVARPGILRPLVLTGGATTIQVGTDQSTIAAADFNGDTKLDLVIGSKLNSHVQIYDGNGDGTFGAVVATASTIGPPSAITINDFNGDGFPDLAVTLSTGGPAILLNDGTGKLQAATQPLASVQPVGITTPDFNGDRLTDLAFLESGTTTDVLLSDEAAQATLPVTTPMLAAGSHMLKASFPGDTNFQPSTSSVLTENVLKTVPQVTWAPPPQDVTYPTPLTNAQLYATSDVAGGTFTYTFPASAHCSPSSVTVPAGSAAFTTNCTPLPGQQLITVLYNPPETFDYESNVTAQATLTVNLPTPTATVNVPSSAAPGDTPSVGFTLDSYPVAVTVTITLGFTDSSSNPASSNGSICFLNIPSNDTTNSSTCPTTDQFTITAGTGGAITPRTFSAGDVAGTVLVTIKLSAGTTDITPAALVPQSLTIAPTVPQIQTASMNPQGAEGLQVVVVGSSSTREISSATFHFTAAAGKTLKTPDVTISNIPEFAQWFSNSGSAQYGSAFAYTQNFTLDEDADTVSGVSVVLQNSQGPSAAQPSQ